MIAGRISGAFLVVAVLRPTKKISLFLFDKVIAKFYCKYVILIKKLGWRNTKHALSEIISNQKFIHIFIILLTLVVVFSNFASKTRAGTISEKAGDTIISEIIKNEFGHLNNEELIEEYMNESDLTGVGNQNYLADSQILKNRPQAVLNAEEDEEDLNSIPQTGKNEPKVPARTEIVKYNVQSGDTISTIAQKFGVSVNTILWENDLNSYSLIRPGDELTILPQTGITHTIQSGDNLSRLAIKYDTDKEKIMEANNLSESQILKIGQKLIIPDGVKTTYVATKQESYSGVSVIKKLVTPPSSTQATSNKMAWPTVGHRITQYYSWRHTGLDIGNKTGTPLYASDAGTVEFAGWSNGYGYNVIINHGGGKKTRYAHCSKFYVESGDEVNKGQTIAAMGSTGWSTGPHIHFEVIINGTKYNPLNYIK